MNKYITRIWYICSYTLYVQKGDMQSFFFFRKYILLKVENWIRYSFWNGIWLLNKFLARCIFCFVLKNEWMNCVFRGGGRQRTSIPIHILLCTYFAIAFAMKLKRVCVCECKFTVINGWLATGCRALYERVCLCIIPRCDECDENKWIVLRCHSQFFYFVCR